MIWYFILVAIPISLFFITLPTTGSNKLDNGNENRKRKRYLLLCGIVLLVLIAFRHYSVGSSDSANYFNNWKKVAGLSLQDFKPLLSTSRMESGYLITVWILSRVFANPQWVFIFSGALFTWSVCRFLYKNCENLLLGITMFICLGLYTFMVQGLRQAIAMSICLFAIEFCKKRSLWGFFGFLLLVILATQYHQTAIVFLPVYFLYGKKIDSVWTLVIFALLLVAVMAIGYLINFANDLFDRNYSNAVEGGGYIALAIYLIIVVVGFVFCRSEDRHDSHYSFFVFLTVMGAVVYAMRYFGTLAAERISFYFMFGQIIVLPKALSSFDSKSSKVLSIIVMGLSIALFFYRIQSSDLIPYMFFWQGA